MVEYVVLIIFGLALDICGAFLIIKPILYFRGVWIGKNLDYFKKDFDDQTQNQDGLVWNNFLGSGICFADYR